MFQNTLSNSVIHKYLAPADQLKLGQIKVWGTGSLPITKVTINAGGTETQLTFSHNPQTEVRH